MSAPATSSKLLTIEAFAQRLGISRSTAYTWLAEGRLVQGIHVLRIGRIVRILWGEQLMEHLLQLSMEETRTPPRPRLKRTGRGGRNRIALDTRLLEIT